MNIREELFSMQDLSYRDFQSKLMPTVPKDSIIGVRTPLLRNFAKRVAKTPGIEAFLQELPHRYYEENNLHAFLIEQMKDVDRVLAELDRFLPFVDNWATCDSMSPKVLFKHRDRWLEKINEWLSSEKEYTVRFAIEGLMSGFLGENFRPEYRDAVLRIRRDEYYIKMMQAWYFATGLSTRFDDFFPYLSLSYMDPWVLNKSVQKAVESYRLTDEEKERIRACRPKK